MELVWIDLKRGEFFEKVMSGSLESSKLSGLADGAVLKVSWCSIRTFIFIRSGDDVAVSLRSQSRYYLQTNFDD